MPLLRVPPNSGVSFYSVLAVDDTQFASPTARLELAASFMIAARRQQTVNIDSVGSGGRSFSYKEAAVLRMANSDLCERYLSFVIVVHMALVLWEGEVESDGLCFISVCILLIYTGDVAVRLWVFGRAHFLDKRWEAVFAALVVELWVATMLNALGFTDDVHLFTQPVRPFLLVAKTPSLRRVFATFVHTVVRAGDIFAIRYYPRFSLFLKKCLVYLTPLPPTPPTVRWSLCSTRWSGWASSITPR